MDHNPDVNALVRERLRHLRNRKKLRLRQMADRTGIPLSSYACMERGFYRISLENLYRILRALETDIGEVWPVDVRQGMHRKVR